MEIKILGFSDTALSQLSKKMLLSLDIAEMRMAQKHYKKLGREPTQIELETIAQTWSEHCKHKTFRANITYTEAGGVKGKVAKSRAAKSTGAETRTMKIKGLFDTFIRQPSLRLKKKNLVSAFSDNAGIVRFNSGYNIAMKAETHNHPSALDPFGGANTGLGGVIRDVLGAGLGAKPFASTDVFCFAPPGYKGKIPQGVLHPKRVFRGVRSGVADYGNKIGIPTVNGAILFDDRYLGNPLVYCGTVGLIPKGMERKAVQPGDAIVVVGGRTGRDGIHGATFSSSGLDEESSSSAVQIGNPIEEKKMMDAILKCRDLGLYNAITDCGAGGFSSAVGEMGAHTGARVHLEKVPLKYKGLLPWEIWLSEAQERMVLAVPKKNIEALRQICEIEGTESAVIGEFTDTKRLELFYEGGVVGELDMEFLHEGIPAKELAAQWNCPLQKEMACKEPSNYGKVLRSLLSMPNIASKEKTVRGYDHEVQGGVVGKPFVGAGNDGPADAAIVRPLLGDWKGVVVSNGINPLYSEPDPYAMACSAIDEAARNAVAVGADFGSIALLDNFSWGNPEKPQVLGGLVRACMGCADSARGLGLPFISGKDSLYNEYSTGTQTISIPGTLLISALGIIPDARKKVSMPFKAEGNLIYVVGETFSELGGSHYAKLKNEGGGKAPKVDFKKSRKIFSALSKLLAKQKPEAKAVCACHDCSEGGLGVALAEMCLAGMLGARIDLRKVRLGEKMARDDFILFSESNSRFIVEVGAAKKREFEKAMKGIAISEIGAVTKNKKLSVTGLGGKRIMDEGISGLKGAWKGALWW